MNSNLRISLATEQTVSGSWEEFLTWSRSQPRIGLHGAFTHHSGNSRGRGLSHSCVIYLHLVERAIMCQIHYLLLSIFQPALPRIQKQHSSKAEITSFHWLVCLRCALPHSDCEGPKVWQTQQTEQLLVQEMALQTGEDIMFSEQIRTLGCFYGCFVFQARNSV